MSRQVGIPTIALGAGFVIAWSCGFWGAKLGTGDASASTLLFWRFAVVAVILWTFVGVRGLRIPRRELRHHVTVGLFAQAGYVAPVYAAVALGVSTGTTSLVDAVQPIVVATLAGPLLGLTVRPVQWSGLVAAFVGVLMIVRADALGGAGSWWVYLLPLLAVASLVVGTLVERGHATTAPVPVMLAVHVSVSTVVFLVPNLLSGDPVPQHGGFWAVVAFLALVPTIAAYALYWMLLRRVDVTSLNTLLLLVVPTTTLGGVVMFDEPLTPLTIVGVGVVAAGVVTVLRGERRPEPVPAA